MGPEDGVSSGPISQREISALLDRSDVRAVLQIPAEFNRDLLTEKSAESQLLTDGTDSNSTAIVLGYAGNIVSKFNDMKLKERLQRKGRTTPPEITMETRAWCNIN